MLALIGSPTAVHNFFFFPFFVFLQTKLFFGCIPQVTGYNTELPFTLWEI